MVDGARSFSGVRKDVYRSGSVYRGSYMEAMVVMVDRLHFRFVCVKMCVQIGPECHVTAASHSE